MSDDVDLTLLLRNLEARYWIEWWAIEDELKHSRKEKRNSLRTSIVHLRQSGLSVTKIARKLNFNTRAVADILNQSGIVVVSNTERIFLLTDEIIKMRKKGLSVKAIGSQLKIAPTVAARVLNENGFQVVHNKVKTRTSEIVSLGGLGKSIKEIALESGISRQTVRKALKENGFELKPGHSPKRKNQCQSQPN